MGITGRTDWKRIVNVSEEMKQHVYEDVKRRFISMVECLVIILLRRMHIMTRFIPM